MPAGCGNTGAEAVFMHAWPCALKGANAEVSPDMGAVAGIADAVVPV